MTSILFWNQVIRYAMFDKILFQARVYYFLTRENLRLPVFGLVQSSVALSNWEKIKRTKKKEYSCIGAVKRNRNTTTTKIFSSYSVIFFFSLSLSRGFVKYIAQAGTPYGDYVDIAR